jgi:hypothetical protein
MMTDELKRWQIICFPHETQPFGEVRIETTEHPNGSWVRHTDAIAALTQMEARKDAAYEERNRVVAWAARMAYALGYKVGVTKTAIEGWSEDWHNCVYIELPNQKQASWHFHDDHAHLFADLPRMDMVWDGHTTEQKYANLNISRYAARMGAL